MHAKIIGIAGMALTLSACGGAKDPQAQLCLDEAARRLDGQVYRLDEKKLAASKTATESGNSSYKVEIILKPGTSGEIKQTLECTVAPPEGDTPARIRDLQFVMEGSGLTG